MSLVPSPAASALERLRRAAGGGPAALDAFLARALEAARDVPGPLELGLAVDLRPGAPPRLLVSVNPRARGASLAAALLEALGEAGVDPGPARRALEVLGPGRPSVVVGLADDGATAWFEELDRRLGPEAPRRAARAAAAAGLPPPPFDPAGPPYILALDLGEGGPRHAKAYVRAAGPRAMAGALETRLGALPPGVARLLGLDGAAPAREGRVGEAVPAPPGRGPGWLLQRRSGVAGEDGRLKAYRCLPYLAGGFPGGRAACRALARAAGASRALRAALLHDPHLRPTSLGLAFRPPDPRPCSATLYVATLVGSPAAGGADPKSSR